jgi:hypothetical protein
MLHQADFFEMTGRIGTSWKAGPCSNVPCVRSNHIIFFDVRRRTVVPLSCTQFRRGTMSRWANLPPEQENPACIDLDQG